MPRFLLGAAAFAAVLSALPACAARPAASPIPLAIDERDFDREPRDVSTPEALADLETALRAFDEAYAGLDGIPRVPASPRVAAARERLGSRPVWSVADFGAELLALFVVPDGHLALGHGGALPVEWPAWPAEPRFLFASYARHAGRGAVLDSSLGDGGVRILAIHTFDSASSADLAMLPQLASDLRRGPAFVVDLRNNSGGNYLYAERFALALTDGMLERLDEREVISAAAASGRANSARRRLARGEVPEASVPLFRSHIASLERQAERLTSERVPRSERLVRGALLRGSAPSPLRSRGVFLVDRGCASACEMLVALVRQIPGIVIAGENTRGGMSVGELALFQLPRSRITLTFGTRAFRDRSGAFAELRGYAPDVRLEGPDVLAQAVTLAKCASAKGVSRHRSEKR